MSKVIIAIITSVLVSNICQADALTFGSGQSTSIDKSNTQKYGYIFETKYQFPYFIEQNLTFDFDLSAHFWQNLYGPDITAASLVPLVKYKIYTEYITIVTRIGIGIAYVDQIRWGNRELGDNWMFEDKIEIGVELTSNHRVALLLQHYSNAALNSKNDGTNLLSINYSYHW